MVAFTDLGAIRMAYEQAGEGEHALVLVHGFTGSSDDFVDVLQPLAKHGRVLALDQRGHGATSNPGSGYGFDQLSADLLGFLDAHGIERCDLLGHSLGGMVAIRFALAHPQRVRSLVLMDTAARANFEPSPATIWAMRNLLPRIPPPLLWRVTRMGRRRLPAPMQRAEREMGSERYWRRLRDKLEALDPVVYDELIAAVFGQAPVVERLSEICCPTLVIVGEEDVSFLEPSRELAAGIPGARLVVVPGAHHSPQIEARERWLEEMAAHLAAARAPSGAQGAEAG